MARKFDGKAWAKGNPKVLKREVRLIDGSDYEFEFRLLVGEPALALKREVFGLQDESVSLTSERRDKGEEKIDADTSVKLAEIDQKVLRAMCRAAVPEVVDYTDENLDLLLMSVGGILSDFGKTLYKACGMTHPMARLSDPDLLGDLPFLSRAKRGRASKAGG